MPDITLEVGTQLSFADHAGDFAPGTGTSLEQGTPTDVQLALANVADAAARQSAKFDLGANRAERYSLMAALEWFTAPTTGERVDFYIGWSPDATAGDGNPGGLSGSDAAYDGGANLTLAEGLAQLDYIGSFICGAFAGIQVADVGIAVPKERYGMLVVVNESNVALAATDDVECHAVLTPIRGDVAAA